MAMILPFISFLIGYFGVEYLRQIRPLLAGLLSKIFIPAIIVYNMVFYKQGSVWLIVLSVMSSILFFIILYGLKKNKLEALCFSYLNGAWLGFPFAMAIFGAQASNIIVALYIGGSLFGNVVAVMAVSQAKQSLSFILKNVLLSPPVIALSIAAILSFWDFHAFENSLLIQSLYSMNKVLVTFSGMCILGMWLSAVRIRLQDLKDSLVLILGRALIAVLICMGTYYMLPIPHERLIFSVIFMFFLLPPAANIVALETHYQGTGTSAKYIAAGTIASAMLIACYGVILHLVL